MSDIRQILVPVDFSEHSREALDYAAELARPFGASLDVLHVWEAPAFVPPASLPDAGVADLSLVELVKANAERSLDEFVTAATKRGVKVRRAEVQPGTPAHSIVDFAKSGGYDLIVIGTHGRTGIARAVIGSVAERVVRHAPCAVLTVRPPAAK